jgi:hypothetical protein
MVPVEVRFTVAEQEVKFEGLCGCGDVPSYRAIFYPIVLHYLFIILR